MTAACLCLPRTDLKQIEWVSVFIIWLLCSLSGGALNWYKNYTVTPCFIKELEERKVTNGSYLMTSCLLHSFTWCHCWFAFYLRRQKSVVSSNICRKFVPNKDEIVRIGCGVFKLSTACKWRWSYEWILTVVSVTERCWIQGWWHVRSKRCFLTLSTSLWKRTSCCAGWRPLWRGYFRLLAHRCRHSSVERCILCRKSLKQNQI